MNDASFPAVTPDVVTPELAWQPLADALRDVGHPIRAWLLTFWGDQELSTRDVAEACGRPINGVAYHVRALAAARLLERADERRRQGGVQHTYRLTGRGHALAATLQALRRWSEQPQASGPANGAR
jgi:predicted ArsR family transcriptional regulator